MAAVAADIESSLAELCDGAFEAFCSDIGGMFDANMTCERQEIGTGTTVDLHKHFKKLAAVHHIQATGTLDGPFHLFFDQGGLFILSGVIVMLPENKIRDEVSRGSVEDTENLTDVCREVGNLLVGSWDRVFREECKGHKHFLKTGTFIGLPWENMSELSLAEDEELLFAVYHMTVEPYPRFCCAAVFPKPTLEPSPAAPTEASQAPEGQEQAEETLQHKMHPEDASAQASEPQPEPQPGPKPEPEPEPKPELEPEPEPEQVAPATDAEPPHHSPFNPRDIPGLTDLGPELVEEPEEVETPEAADPAHIPADIRPVVEKVVGQVDDEVDLPQTQAPEPQELDETKSSFAERVFADSLTHVPEGAITQVLDVQAADVMTTDVVWCNPEDAVQNVIEAMQQHNTGYVLVGSNGALQGLVSNSNILSAVSPYLRPMFAKWRRPEDDATLQIKVKWIMSRPVRTVTPDATLGSMAETMRRYGGRCLPVVDEQGKVHGIITVFDILLRILEAGQAFSWKGKPPQAPAFLI
jgi:CBS domain-containing protein